VNALKRVDFTYGVDGCEQAAPPVRQLTHVCDDVEEVPPMKFLAASSLHAAISCGSKMWPSASARAASCRYESSAVVEVGRETAGMGAKERAESDLSVRIAASVGPNETAACGSDEIASAAGSSPQYRRPPSDTPGRVPTKARCPGGSGENGSEALGLVPLTVDEALRLAVKLAVDGGDYERATDLLNVLKGR
jgi:hypothetical protein